ncbi:MAG: hypothetical protein IKX98_03420 [Clostridia bacterium]|nr:hypothetical protein [Clostridia bacterium]
MSEKAKELFNGITNIDDELIESALAATPESVKTEELTALAKKTWFKWAAAAAIFCVIIAGAFVALNATGVFAPASEQIQSGESGEPHIQSGANSDDEIGGVDLLIGDSTYINGDLNVRYRLLTGADVHRFEPLLKDGLPRGFESLLTYWIKEEDLGEQMGVVTGSELGIAGQKVYHFALLPDLDGLCIIRYDGKYRFFVGDVVLTDVTSTDAILAANGMPEECARIAVYNASYEENIDLLFSTEDPTLMSEICRLVKSDGMAENYADLDAETQELLKAPVELCRICFYSKKGMYAQFYFYPSASVLIYYYFYTIPPENAQRLYEIINP